MMGCERGFIALSSDAGRNRRKGIGHALIGRRPQGVSFITLYPKLVSRSLYRHSGFRVSSNPQQVCHQYRYHCPRCILDCLQHWQSHHTDSTQIPHGC